MLIDLNCDMGESYGVWEMGDDEEMLNIVTSANIACGFHAGDPEVMFTTLQNARQKNVAVGAHPGFPDITGFGRRVIKGFSSREIRNMMIYQIGALKAMAESQGLRLQHVKTHGALGNMAAEDEDMANAVAEAIYQVDKELLMVVMPGMCTEKAALRQGLRVIREVYLDRTYADNGNLLSRRLPGAVLHDPRVASERLLQMIGSSEITTVNGQRIPVKIDSVCVHGDSHGAGAMAKEARFLLENQGITFAPMSEVIRSKN